MEGGEDGCRCSCGCRLGGGGALGRGSPWPELGRVPSSYTRADVASARPPSEDARCVFSLKSDVRQGLVWQCAGLSRRAGLAIRQLRTDGWRRGLGSCCCSGSASAQVWLLARGRGRGKLGGPAASVARRAREAATPGR